MAIAYIITVDSDDDGLGEVITPTVLEVSWRLGMEAAYDSVAAPSWARVVVRNRDGAYSEAGPLRPGQRLSIASDDGATVRVHFTGVIRAIEPSAGEYGPRTATIWAAGAEAVLAASRVRQAWGGPSRADDIINRILDAVPFRRPILTGYCLVGVAGYNALGTAKLFGPAIARDLQSGKSLLLSGGEDWGAGVRASDAIQQMASAERGRFFIARDGTAVFLNRHHTLTVEEASATFRDDMEGLSYSYGADVVNHVRVTMRPRLVGAAGEILWALANPQPLPPRASRRIIAPYRDAEQRPSGALAVIPPRRGSDYLAATAAQGGQDRTEAVVVALVQAAASAATLDIRNTSDETLYLTALNLRGTPLRVGDRLALEQSDETSASFYGRGTLDLELSALGDIETAEQLARYELARRKDPRGVARALDVAANRHPQHALARTLFDRIAIQESQTGHSADYFIIGEAHTVDRGGARHRVRWTLEPADSERFVIIGYSALDSGRVLAY